MQDAQALKRDSVKAEGYSSRDIRGVVQLYSAAGHGGTGVAGVRLCAIDGSTHRAGKSMCAAVQKGARGFYEFLSNL